MSFVEVDTFSLIGLALEAHIHNYDGDWIEFGPTPLIAVMRCYVASKLGKTVQIPK